MMHKFHEMVTGGRGVLTDGTLPRPGVTARAQASPSDVLSQAVNGPLGAPIGTPAKAGCGYDKQSGDGRKERRLGLHKLKGRRGQSGRLCDSMAYRSGRSCAGSCASQGVCRPDAEVRKKRCGHRFDTRRFVGRWGRYTCGKRSFNNYTLRLSGSDIGLTPTP